MCRAETFEHDAVDGISFCSGRCEAMMYFSGLAVGGSESLPVLGPVKIICSNL